MLEGGEGRGKGTTKRPFPRDPSRTHHLSNPSAVSLFLLLLLLSSSFFLSLPYKEDASLTKIKTTRRRKRKRKKEEKKRRRRSEGWIHFILLSLSFPSATSFSLRLLLVFALLYFFKRDRFAQREGPGESIVAFISFHFLLSLVPSEAPFISFTAERSVAVWGKEESPRERERDKEREREEERKRRNERRERRKRRPNRP